MTRASFKRVSARFEHKGGMEKCACPVCRSSALLPLRVELPSAQFAEIVSEHIFAAVHSRFIDGKEIGGTSSEDAKNAKESRS
jgi:hypothetical protein